MTDFVALKAELDTDPLARGYAGMADEVAAIDLNTFMRDRNRTSMTGKEVKDAIINADWDSRSNNQQSILLSLFARDDLDPFGIDAHIFTAAMSGHLNTTVADLAVLRVESVSRATELGFGVLTPGDVNNARALV